jgi:hypothetical protein
MRMVIIMCSSYVIYHFEKCATISWDCDTSFGNQFLEEEKIEMFMVRLGIEFLESELNSYSNCEVRGKKLCLGVEFLD